MYPIKSRPEPFGHAGKPGKSTAQKRQHSARWENSVGGTKTEARARFGRKDELVTEEHDDGTDTYYVESDRNMLLCRVVDTVKVCDNLGATVYADTFRISYWTPEDQAALEALQATEKSVHEARVATLVKRATRLGMTLVDYCAKYEVAL